MPLLQVNHLFSSIDRIRRKAIKDHLTHEEILALRQQWVFDCDGYNALTIQRKEYLRGYFDSMANALYDLLVFCYVIDGKTLPIDSEEYRKYSPQEVHEKWSKTGGYFWRDGLKRFS